MTSEIVKIASFCAYQERSRPEIEQKLSDLGVDEAEWDEIFAFLEKEKYFNEKRFAESYVGGKFRVKKWGKRKIRFEIKAHRIPAYMLAAALESEISDEDYEKTIEFLIEKKSMELHRDTPINKKGKIARYLLQKGYEWEEFGDKLHFL